MVFRLVAGIGSSSDGSCMVFIQELRLCFVGWRFVQNWWMVLFGVLQKIIERHRSFRRLGVMALQGSSSATVIGTIFSIDFAIDAIAFP